MLYSLVIIRCVKNQNKICTKIKIQLENIQLKNIQLENIQLENITCEQKLNLYLFDNEPKTKTTSIRIINLELCANENKAKKVFI